MATSKVKSIAQDLRGKHFIVTGANTGIGYAAALELAKMGAKVTLACRSVERGEQAIKSIRAEALAKPVKEGVDLVDGLEDVDVQLEVLDLGSLQSVIAFAKRFKEAGSKVDVLINNAGIMALPERKETVDGLEMQIGVNHFGGHLLTRLMVPMFPEGGRVLFTSSIAHNEAPRLPKTNIDWDNVNYEEPDSYNAWMAYSRSKLANVLDAKEFATRLADRKINTYAVHPGIVATEIFRNMTDNSLTSRVSRIMAPFVKYILASPLTGALTTLKCAIDPAVAGPEFSGKYWGYMKEERPSKLASDPANSSRYWDVTEKILETKLGKKVNTDVSYMLVLHAWYDSSFWKLFAAPYCRRVVETKSRQNRTFDPGGSQGHLSACPLMGTWRAFVCGEVLRAGAALFWRIDDLRLESLQERAVRANFYAVRVAFSRREFADSPK